MTAIAQQTIIEFSTNPLPMTAHKGGLIINCADSNVRASFAEAILNFIPHNENPKKIKDVSRAFIKSNSSLIKSIPCNDSRQIIQIKGCFNNFRAKEILTTAAEQLNKSRSFKATVLEGSRTVGKKNGGTVCSYTLSVTRNSRTNKE